MRHESRSGNGASMDGWLIGWLLLTTRRQSRKSEKERVRTCLPSPYWLRLITTHTVRCGSAQRWLCLCQCVLSIVGCPLQADGFKHLLFAGFLDCLQHCSPSLYLLIYPISGCGFPYLSRIELSPRLPDHGYPSITGNFVSSVGADGNGNDDNNNNDDKGQRSTAVNVEITTWQSRLPAIKAYLVYCIWPLRQK